MNRSTLRASSLVALLSSCLPATLACSGASPGGATASTGESHASLLTIYLPTLPAGVQCLVTTVSGADSETISTTVPAGGVVPQIGFGLLAPGAVTVSAAAYNAPCPGTGTPSWVSEPVQSNVVAGVVGQVPLVLRPNTQGTGTLTFSQPAIAIAAGPRTSYAVLADGTVRAWGANEDGELGYAGAGSPTPVVVPGVSAATQIEAGNGFACVIRTDQSVMCWGYDAGSFLPASAFGTISAPVVSPGLYSVQLTALGGNVALIGGGANGPMGDIGGGYNCNSFGPCGPASFQWSANGATGPVISVAVGTLSAAGVVNACWITEHGATLCTWQNTTGVNGGLGGSSGPYAYAPAASHVFAGAEPGATGNFACAILDSGNVDCWGSNSYGELGIGSLAAPAGAVSVPNLHGVGSMALSRSSSVGSAFACAAGAGGVLCSGSNDSGQLGNGTGQASTGFVPVTGLTSAVALAAGQAHACALDGEGAVHCWGVNDDGELGDGTITARFTPVTVQPW